ncbi:hypothetical protein Axy20_031 [Achromobacter phage vB_AxyS_19-32_Axy20]|nr:hypothetical protein Axy18_030 [Achromobacter phage vB_AxyS_19-32_Axy18]QDH84533.1 hypothetical protein Axy20_031 [Achromobacter phage vB_AxyS_19-32_Axy20]WNO48638.1 hypothetical protein [Achromobacter phage shaaii_LB5]
MITCPNCIAVRARIRAVAMLATGRSPDKVTQALNEIYRQGFFYIREYENGVNAIYYQTANGEFHVKDIKR